MTLIYLVCIESPICCYFQDNLFACEFQQEVFTHHFFNCFPSFCFVFWNWTNMYVGTLILPYRPLKLWSFFFILFLLCFFALKYYFCCLWPNILQIVIWQPWKPDFPLPQCLLIFCWELQSSICSVTFTNYFCNYYIPCHLWSLRSLFH